MQRSFSVPPTNDILPVFQSSSKQSTRLSSISLNLNRSKSFSVIQESYNKISVRKILNWGWGWMFTKESPKFKDKAVLGGRNGYTFGDLVQRAKIRVRKLLILDSNGGQPQTCRYSSFDYSKNFDDGGGKF